MNRVLQSETTPDAWSNLILLMLYKKKGSIDDLANFRPLALASCIAKLFTMILYLRASKWCEENDKLPEWQSGFRIERSCLDNIFTLDFLIQKHISKEKGKLYALFIDFKGAFDSINHQILWSKLFKIGLSTKFVKILSCIYSKANVKIRKGNGYLK